MGSIIDRLEEWSLLKAERKHRKASTGIGLIDDIASQSAFVSDMFKLAAKAVAGMGDTGHRWSMQLLQKAAPYHDLHGIQNLRQFYYPLLQKTDELAKAVPQEPALVGRLLDVAEILTNSHEPRFIEKGLDAALAGARHAEYGSEERSRAVYVVIGKTRKLMATERSLDMLNEAASYAVGKHQSLGVQYTIQRIARWHIGEAFDSLEWNSSFGGQDSAKQEAQQRNVEKILKYAPGLPGADVAGVLERASPYANEAQVRRMGSIQAFCAEPVEKPVAPAVPSPRVARPTPPSGVSDCI